VFAVKPIADTAAMRDLAELHAFIQERNDRAPCAVCGGTAWRTTTRIVRLPLVSESDGSTEEEGPEAVVYACRGCANDRLFLLSLLDELLPEWRAARNGG
jgi:hypothetical protein